MNMLVKQINLTEHRAGLLALWKTVFPEDADFAAAFLDKALPPVTGWTCLVDDQPVSAAYFLPAHLHIGDVTCTAQYVYAVATLPEYRGLGCASSLLCAAAQQYDDDLFYLYPATSSAAGLYEKLGYRDIFRRTTVTADGGPTAPSLRDVSVFPFSAEKYTALREKYRPSAAHCRADLSGKLLDLLLSRATLLEFAGGFALMQETDDTCVLSEVVAPPNTLPALLGYVASMHPDKPVTARLPGGTEKAGMVLPLTEKAKQLISPIQTIPFSGPLFDL